MGSGHTGRNGRGANRRARRGPPNQRGPETPNRQTPATQTTTATPRTEPATTGTALPDATAEARPSATPLIAQPAPSANGNGNGNGHAPSGETSASEAKPALPRNETPAEQHSRPRNDRRGPQLIPPATNVRVPSDRASFYRPGEPRQAPGAPPLYRDQRDQRDQRDSAASPSRPTEHLASAPPEADTRTPIHAEQDGRSQQFVLTQRSQPAEPDEEGEPAVYERPRHDVRGDIGGLIDSLHEVFVRDRAIASQANTGRCGICYLHFPLAELTYRDVEGFYVCAECAHALGHNELPMVRRQRR